MSKYDYAIRILEEHLNAHKKLLKSKDVLINKWLQKKWIAELQSAIEALRKAG